MKDFKLPIDFMDNYILKSNPEYVMVYLYAYRHKTDNGAVSPQDIARELGMDISQVTEAIEYWCGLGFDIFKTKKFPPVADKTKYSAKEITDFASKDSELATLYEMTEKIMCRVLSPNNQQTLFWIYNDLGMSTAMIVLMLNYCKKIDKCNMRYIEKLAFDWSEKGIFTFEDAEKYISDMERANTYEQRLKKLFGLDRAFISTEKPIIENWCNQLKPTKDDLLRAYEICIERTGKFSVKYMNAILVNWKEDKNKAPKPRTTVPTPKATKFSNFTQKSGIDYKKIEMDALKKKISKAGEING